ncbi:unnamed protein product, partial [Rotaria sordida]
MTTKYINRKFLYFCQCDEGYSGDQCNIKHNCSCSSDSYCLASSICVCPMNKFGSKCYLKSSICQTSNNPCQNNGLCIPVDDRMSLNKSTCLCTENFYETRSNRTYYLGVLREKFIESEHIQTRILSNYQCLPINELMNNTFLNYPFVHHAKYYPYLCQQQKQLKCFYDNRYMCICDVNRFSNCFTFNHTLSYDCQGENICENGGLCFQHNIKCPILSICACPECYYGTKCQFSTRGFVLSLGYILGYHIKPNVLFYRQPFVIKISLIIIVFMFILGMINGTLSIAIFCKENVRQTGCSLYLLTSSCNSLLLIIVSVIKFSQLILSQTAVLTNRTFLTLNCILLDMILKVLVASNDGFYGCVALERVFTVINGIKFNQVKTKQIAKWIILCVFLLTIITHIHDPIHRQLINDSDGDEQRLWCLVRYSSSINISNIFVTFFRFLISFSINLISTIILIISIARSRSKVRSKIPFKKHLQQQLYQHKHH